MGLVTGAVKPAASTTEAIGAAFPLPAKLLGVNSSIIPSNLKVYHTWASYAN
jgi:hypothetical protein